MTNVCKNCKKNFSTYKKAIVYCSKECLLLGLSSSRRGKHPCNKGQDSRVALVCKTCGSTYKRYSYQAINSKFCSAECLQKSKAGQKRPPEVCKKISESQAGRKLSPARYDIFMKNKWSAGNSHPCSDATKQKISLANRKNKTKIFNGFVCNEDKAARSRFRAEIQKKVFERDNYTCQLCGERGQKLQVDHIQSWAEYVELRFDINNCRTLCMACHYKITFGRELPKDVAAWGHNFSQIGRIVT